MIKIPHVVVNGEVTIQKIFNEFEQILIRDGGDIIRTSNTFLSHDKTDILIETLTIENGVKSQFLALINQREDGVVVRIYPGTDIEKTNGVKRSLAEIAKQILAKNLNTKIGKTNLQDFLS